MKSSQLIYIPKPIEPKDLLPSKEVVTGAAVGAAVGAIVGRPVEGAAIGAVVGHVVKKINDPRSWIIS